MSDEKSPARISHRRFATSCSEMESIMHKVQAKAILSAKNGMNIYRVVSTAVFTAMQEAPAIR